MPRTIRYRSHSSGSFIDTTINNSSNVSVGKKTTSSSASPDAAQKLFDILSAWRDSRGKGLLHQISHDDLWLADQWIRRANQLSQDSNDELNRENNTVEENSTLEKWMLQRDQESGYTPLHWAILDGNLSALLLLLGRGSGSGDRLVQRPIHLLQGDASTPTLKKMIQIKDCEGLTPLGLLISLQKRELRLCRESLPRARVIRASGALTRLRSSSFEIHENTQDQDEFSMLREGMSSNLLEGVGDKASSVRRNISHGCEVMSFGRANHCALGVSDNSSSNQRSRPHRVQEFSLSNRGVMRCAVSVSVATHHTLVVCRDGHLYAFGLGKGGRLGTGDERPAPLPVRVMSGLGRRQVVHAAAAENHSLCVTSDGSVYAWGSNRFGQLGGSDNRDHHTFRPKRVDDLRTQTFVAVAAGDRHSVALTSNGQVYTWGDNQAGQLGYMARSSSVRRVDSLWNAQPRKIVHAIDASERSTLVLVAPTGIGLPVNSVHSWGHGNHMPIRVNFETKQSSSPHSRTRNVDPVAISCAKFHNAAVSRDGRVYTWGLHSEQLGTHAKKSPSMIIASPQLVTGMLPENGGGVAVHVSASESHTAVVTACGSMYTWGSSDGKGVLGHEGVRWQPSPKKVLGVYRAVQVAACKEHTVYLMGTSFPEVVPREDLSLESLSAREVIRHVDLFNVIPLLIMAERTSCQSLLSFCQHFVRLNLDAVITVGRKSEMDVYLKEQLVDSKKSTTRDSRLHPLFRQVATCGDDAGWNAACHQLVEGLPISTIVKYQHASERAVRRSRARSFRESLTEERKGSTSLQTGFQGVSERCLMLSANLDLHEEEEIRSKHTALVKETRGIRKRLGQIGKLQGKTDMTGEEREKVARKPLLEADLVVLDSALAKIARLMEERNMIVHRKNSFVYPQTNKAEEETSKDLKIAQVFRCEVCDIVCPDAHHLEVHKSGRKHRNKVLSMRNEKVPEKKDSARVPPPRVVAIEDQSEPSATQSRACQKASTEPRYRLPPPPLPVGPSTTTTAKWSKKAEIKPPTSDLRAIMSEQQTRFLEQKSSSPKKTQWLSPDEIPKLKAAPWLSSPVVRLKPKKSSELDSHTMISNEKSRTLCDFMERTPKKVESSKHAPWASPKTMCSEPDLNSATSTPVSTKTLIQIQQEEEDFKARNGRRTDVKDNKWYVAREEKAGSLLQIQEKEEEERQMQLLVEEQRQIELQLEEEKRRKEQKAITRNQTGRKKKQNTTRRKSKNPNNRYANNHAASNKRKKERSSTSKNGRNQTDPVDVTN